MASSRAFRGTAVAQPPRRTAAKRRTTGRATAKVRPLEPAEAAWLAIVPTAVVVTLLIYLIGPPLGAVIYPEGTAHFWLSIQESIRPEPTEQARFLLSLTGPLILTALTIRLQSLPERRPTWAGLLTDLVPVAQIVALVLVAYFFVMQRVQSFGEMYTSAATAPQTVYFTNRTLLVAALIVVAIALGLRSDRVREVGHGWLRETRARAIVYALLALAATIWWLVPAVNLDSTIAATHEAVYYHLRFTFDEAFAVVNGRAPLVDFAAQYGSLWPYVMAGGMSLLGTSLGVFTALMATVTGLSLLGLYDVLRRISRSSLAALLLFLPLLATSMYMMRGPLEMRYSLGNYFATFPLRYSGPLLLAWLFARHLDGARPRRLWPVFLAAGLVVLNNGDFGIPALGATIAALLWLGGRPTWPVLRALALQLVIGLAGAYLLVSALTLAYAGSLPDISLLFRYARMYAVAGFAMLPMPATGFHVVIYLTYVAVIGLATVRVLRGDEGRVLTAMLVWSGIFGLGSASYYVGRSHPEVLTNIFPAWAFAVTLLTFVALRAAAARPRGRLLAMEVACLCGFALLACSFGQWPRPWQEAERLQSDLPRIFEQLDGTAWVRARVEPGEPVLILMQLGHRMADQIGVDNVAPYTGSQSIPTQEQLDETVALLREAGGRKVFLSQWDTLAELPIALQRDGFVFAGSNGDIEEWVDQK
ncbi:hypothetical protein VSS74_17560 [Conexibacter stalactiti]|uniref:Glycosyltransferase RgtA/B/C/D-like domain-containing protein n=1 Tax=Conexibacter stalactiti TaxID=1940611 RepID=A0ABU4HTP9_9ACTN|nr:hypothetical protein [Conexibacter stalactiti]MDW5596159.1 hypothetical protein [Conexibacter stalactiti]MEC5036801.1 hypothetical protein [Conexibacter stalactiti]